MAGSLLTRPGQAQYGDLLLGADTPYRWRALTGWEDLPPLDSGSVPRSTAHGALPGSLLAQPRTISFDGLVVRAPNSTIGAVVGALNAATVPVEEERPLVVWLDERGPLLAYARATRRAIPTTLGYALGTITGGALEFVASDPLRYELVEQIARATLPLDEPGLDWHGETGLDWHSENGRDASLDFGTPGSTGNLTAYNAGSAPAHPIVEFRGPVSLPSVTDLATGASLEYDLDLAADDLLSVDTGEGTVTLNRTASRLHTATARSMPEQLFALLPGTTDLAFRAAPGSSPAASIAVRWRSAHW
ncbi:phage tail domain-containing protein [Streptomyces sp. BPTC-684]|uniref:phage distal tail protein n=1 Tax=Streptomyces sp. BPTC-684 TaxID=3043734 RepID=UPI0024B0F0DE|nr:phage tail domain-containing protein [Streptomyces sp. BPTC-684]WHM36319.1 phage tail family protein [Streptomyces sp. BPTC-684]